MCKIWTNLKKKKVKVELKNLLREIKNDLNREIYKLLKGKEPEYC